MGSSSQSVRPVRSAGSVPCRRAAEACARHSPPHETHLRFGQQSSSGPLGHPHPARSTGTHRRFTSSRPPLRPSGCGHGASAGIRGAEWPRKTSTTSREFPQLARKNGGAGSFALVRASTDLTASSGWSKQRGVHFSAGLPLGTVPRVTLVPAPTYQAPSTNFCSSRA